MDSEVFPHDECATCRQPPRFTLLLTVSSDGDTGDAIFHLPNQRVREMQGTSFDNTRQVPFCHKCVREVEGNLRRTINTLAEKHGKTRPQYSEFDF